MKSADERMQRLKDVFKKVVDSSITNIGTGELKKCFSGIDSKHLNDIQSILVNSLGNLQFGLEVR